MVKERTKSIGIQSKLDWTLQTTGHSFGDLTEKGNTTVIHDDEENIEAILKDVGFLTKNLGFKYVRDAICICLRTDLKNSLTGYVYSEIAEKYETNKYYVYNAIKRELDKVILKQSEGFLRLFGQLKKGDIAVPEFIFAICDYIYLERGAETIKFSEKGNIEEMIGNYLKNVGFPVRVAGWSYAIDAIKTVLEHESNEGVTLKRDVYPDIAQKYAVLDLSVGDSIKHALKKARQNNTELFSQLFGNCTEKNVTVGQFIFGMSDYIRSLLNQ